MYVFSGLSYICEIYTSLEDDENRETPEQGSLVSVIPTGIRLILVVCTVLQVLPRPQNVSPGGLEWFLWKTRSPRGFVLSALGISHGISYEANRLKILDKDSRNPPGSVCRS